MSWQLGKKNVMRKKELIIFSSLEEFNIIFSKRWKIDNQGFNHQKTKLYHIEHVNSYHYTAMKNHYLLVQISDF